MKKNGFFLLLGCWTILVGGALDVVAQAVNSGYVQQAGSNTGAVKRSDERNSRNQNGTVSNSVAPIRNPNGSIMYQTVPIRNANGSVQYKKVPVQQRNGLTAVEQYQQYLQYKRNLQKLPTAQNRNNGQYPVSVQNNRNTFQQKMYQHSGNVWNQTNQAYQNRSTNGYQNGYVNGAPNRYTSQPVNTYANRSVNGYQNQSNTAGSQSRLFNYSGMKFSLTSSSRRPQNALDSERNTPAAGDVWTAFLTGHYSPELVHWYVNRYNIADQNRPYPENQYAVNRNIVNSRNVAPTATVANTVNSGQFYSRQINPIQVNSGRPAAHEYRAPRSAQNTETIRQNPTISQVGYSYVKPNYTNPYNPNNINPNNINPNNINPNYINPNYINPNYNRQTRPLPINRNIGMPNGNYMNSNVPVSNFGVSTPMSIESGRRYTSSLKVLFDKLNGTSEQPSVYRSPLALEVAQRNRQARQIELARQNFAPTFQQYDDQYNTAAWNPNSYPNEYENTDFSVRPNYLENRIDAYAMSNYTEPDPVETEQQTHDANQQANYWAWQQGIANRQAEILRQEEELARERQWLEYQQNTLTAQNNSNRLPDEQFSSAQQVNSAPIFSPNPIRQVSGTVPQYQLPEQHRAENNKKTRVYRPKNDFVQ